MQYARVLLVAAGLLSSAFLNAFAGEVKIIANSSVKEDIISAVELKRVFLEQNNSLEDGSHVEPVLEKDGPVHEAFLHDYLGRTDDDLQTYYRALVFTGRGSMPKELNSDAEVVAYVARTRGALGYVSTATSAEGVKTLAVVHAGNLAPRTLLTLVEPEYPETLKRLNIGGTVRLHLTITPSGNVEFVEVLGGNPILAESAATAVKRWIYSPSHSRSTLDVTIPFDPSH
jgi:TonB family protein